MTTLMDMGNQLVGMDEQYAVERLKQSGYEYSIERIGKQDKPNTISRVIRLRTDNNNIIISTAMFKTKPE